MLNLRLVAVSRPTGIFGRLVGTIFFLFFLGMGLLFVVFIGKEALKRVETFRWPMIPCTILSSSVVTEKSTENPYRFAVDYEYEVAGKSYHSRRAALSDVRSGNYSDTLRMVERYPESGHATCYVNPANPQEAVLQRSSLWFVLLLAFPVPFILIGGIGIVAMWRSSTASVSAMAISRTARPAMSNGCLAAFFSIFLIAGLAALVVLLIRPLVKIQQARHWQEVLCTILSSEVQHHRGDNGTTYSVDIFYRYSLNGKEYRSNRYSFMTGSSSGYEGKAAVVARYRPGNKAVCYVNPSDPTEAVLVRSATAEMWFGLLPALFVAVGAGGLVYCVRGRGARKSVVPALAQVLSGGTAAVSYAAAKTEWVNGPEGDGSPVELKPRISPMGKFLGGLVAALFWNGIVSVFVVHAVNGWRHGRGEWFLTVFMIPFVLVGLGILGFVIYAFVGLFSPRVKLTVSSVSALPGAKIQLNWTLEGQVRRVPRLRIYLEGREEATYARGTTSCTDKAVFATVPIIDIQENFRVGSGNAELQVPPGAIHSFTSEHNKIIWAIFVRADVTHMPDVKDEFELFVLPQPLAPPMKL